MIRPEGSETTEITESLSWVTTIRLPRGLKNAWSRLRKVWPGASWPSFGNCQRIWPLGLIMRRRLLLRSAIRIGPGSIDGFEPGCR